ncbi:autotransporter domain-containing protein [Luteimonas sp. R10]|uniref:autotransporter domain-containing protein n=1 Tax=Luteimonas sp. R10 TaxID=3108176 RepID=UPI00308CB343|nr:autotransporter domain-containing protein [Luteimonas sp. R10]
MYRDLAGRLRYALLLGLLGFACWAPQAAASSFCQLINSPDGTPRTGSVEPNQNVNINGPDSWANNAGDKVTVEISNPTGLQTRGTFTGGGLHISFFEPGVFEGTSSDYYRGGGGTIYINSQEGGFDYTISCESALPVLASVTPGSGGAGTTVTLGGQALYGLADEVAVTIGGVAATITNNIGTSITATVPAGLAAGSHDVTVTTEAGASTLPDAFTVLAANQPPVNSVPGSQTVEQDGALVFSGGNGNPISVSDPDAGSGNVLVELAATNGLITLGSTTWLTFFAGDGADDASMMFEGSLSDINAALNGTTYTPTLGYSGPASLQITSNDLENTGSGGAMSDTDTVAITVLATDAEPPVVTAIDRVDASPTNADSVRYAVSFSEAVTGVDAADFSVTATGTATGAVALVATTDSILYTVTVNGVGGDGTLRLDVNGSDTGIIDVAGNPAAGFTGGQAYIVDDVAPVVTSVSVPANGRYLAGDALDFTVHLSETVVVDTAGGTPYLELTVGSAPQQVSYVSGSGTGALAFRYIVQADDRDYDGVMLGTTIVDNGGTLRDATGNDTAPALNAVGNTSGVLVGTGEQTITFGAQAAQAFAPGGTFALDPVATASSGLPVSYGTQTADVCTISGTTVTMQSAGTCTIAADQAGNDDYAAAPTVTQDIAIGQAAQAITAFAADPAAPAFVPDGTFAVSATGGASGNPVLFGTATPTVCTVSGSTVTMQSAGTCTVTADQAGNDNYGAAPQARLDVVIGAGSQAITFGAQAPQTFVAGGTFALDPPATASSGLPVSYRTQTAGVCAISDATVTMQSAGTCTIAADQAGNDDYAAAATVTQSIAIGKAAQAISQFVANPDAPTYAAGGTFAVSATGGDSGNPVVFASTSPGVCTIEGATVTMLSAGACALTADQAGNDDYAAAPQATLEVAIAAATPTLTWIEDLQKILGDPAFDLPDPDSGSTGAFSFASSNTGVATVSGPTVTIVGTGTTTLVATQAAAGNYTAATVRLTLTVATRPDPTLDPEVVGGLQAQVDASVRFANAQQDNIRDRLRQLRDGRGNPSANNLTFSASAGSGPELSLGTERLAGAMPTLAHGWGLWVAGTISLGERDHRSGSSGFDFRSNGLTLGVDRLFGRNLVLGVAGGLGWNDTDFDDSPSQQDARQRSMALYGLWRGDGPLFVDGQLGLGRLDFDLWRWSEPADATAQAGREGDQLYGGLTVGYEHAGERSRLAGYGRYDASHTTLDAYRESGLGIYDLSYGRQTIDNSTLALGVEGSYQLRTTTVSLRPYWSLEYRQALENRGDARLNYVVQPVTQDYLLGMRSYSDDTLALGAGLDVDLDSGWNLSFLLRREQSSGIGSASSFGLRVSYGQALGADMATRGGAGYVTPGIDPFRAIDPQTGLPLQP